MHNKIIIKGARTHNLKNIDINIPKNQFCVITGVSGSGKTSLAFDTIFAEGQRKYVESLSSYARQFLALMDKPEVEHIEGLSPSISIEQKSTSHNPRSTVGTITEIHDYLRVLYAKIGTAKCPTHMLDLKAQTVTSITNQILELDENLKVMILSPIIINKKGENKKLLSEFSQKGFVRARIDGEIVDLSEDINLEPNKKHCIDIIIDRIKIKKTDDLRTRISDSISLASDISNGLIYVSSLDNSFDEKVFSTKYACRECGYSIPELEPRNFSFNNPNGACEFCHGLGSNSIITEDSIIEDDSLSIKDGATKGWTQKQGYSYSILTSVCNHYNISLETPYSKLKNEQKNIIMYGNNGEEIELSTDYRHFKQQRKSSFLGIIAITTKKYLEANDEDKQFYTPLLDKQICPQCNGERLKTQYRNVFINNMSLPKLGDNSILEIINFLKDLKLSSTEEQIAQKLLKEIIERLTFLNNVGLDYISLNRTANTLSGGEAQRIRLASQIGSGLTGVMYVLDEPSIGLHQKDNEKLLEALNHLKKLGNTLIVIEHDEDTMNQADFIVDIGPKAGIHGGEIVAYGTPDDIKNSKNSITGQYLSKKKIIEIPKVRKKSKKFISLEGAKGNNLKDVDIKIPLGCITCVTGVSGSGKSTLINDTLYKIARQELNQAKGEKPCEYKKISGLNYLEKVVNIDQTPVGKTPRSNCATYTDVFTNIRELFSQTKEARARGYTPGRFSFNIKGGRCEACNGDGVKKIEMNFLPAVYIKCEECNGCRYNKETLDIYYKGKNINDVLEMSIEEALTFFDAIPTIKSKLKTISEVGLSYIKLGQSATTFSGGEAQRVKIAKELSKKNNGNNLYILDEPTTGLHFEDINILLKVLFKLRDAGNTIVIIEHNLDVIKSADYIIDLGPDGGYKGGEIVCCGTPEEVKLEKKSYTGQFLAKIV